MAGWVLRGALWRDWIRYYDALERSDITSLPTGPGRPETPSHIKTDDACKNKQEQQNVD